MLSATLLLIGGLAVGDWNPRVSNFDQGHHVVWTQVNSSGTDVAIMLDGTPIQMAPNTSGPHSPDVDSNGQHVAVVWRATDNNPVNIQQVIYLSVDGGVPIEVARPGEIPRVAINQNNQIFVYWVQAAPNNIVYEEMATNATIVCLQAYSYQNGQLTAIGGAVPGPASSQQWGQGYINYNSGDISCDASGGCVLTYTRVTTQNGATGYGSGYPGNPPGGGSSPPPPTGVWAHRYTASMYGLNQVYAVPLLGTLGSSSLGYSWAFPACFNDGTCVVAVEFSPSDVEVQPLDAAGNTVGNMFWLINYNESNALSPPMSGGDDYWRFSIASDMTTTASQPSFVLAWDTHVIPGGPYVMQGGANVVWRRVVLGALDAGATWQTFSSQLYSDVFHGNPSVGHMPPASGIYNPGQGLTYEFRSAGPTVSNQDYIWW